MAKYLDGIQLTEGRADSVPRLIGTLNYSEFTTPSATLWKNMTASLSRNAKHRTFIINSTLNIGSSAALIAIPYESLVSSGGSSGSTTLIAGIGATTNMVDSSERVPILSSHVDSVKMGVPIGSTLPTSGKIDFWVVEYF